MNQMAFQSIGYDLEEDEEELWWNTIFVIYFKKSINYQKNSLSVFKSIMLQWSICANPLKDEHQRAKSNLNLM